MVEAIKEGTTCNSVDHVMHWEQCVYGSCACTLASSYVPRTDAVKLDDVRCDIQV